MFMKLQARQKVESTRINKNEQKIYKIDEDQDKIAVVAKVDVELSAFASVGNGLVAAAAVVTAAETAVVTAVAAVTTALGTAAYVAVVDSAMVAAGGTVSRPLLTPTLGLANRGQCNFERQESSLLPTWRSTCYGVKVLCF